MLVGRQTACIVLTAAVLTWVSHSTPSQAPSISQRIRQKPVYHTLRSSRCPLRSYQPNEEFPVRRVEQAFAMEAGVSTSPGRRP